MRWDIFCKVIDNHGDLGVCWRLARDLASRGHPVRLWVDEPSALAWMAPELAADGLAPPGIEVHPWPIASESPAGGWPAPGDVVVEAFGCELPPAFVAGMQRPTPPRWINLEYLSAESYVERSHGLMSPVFSGAGAGLHKHFFYPGFTARTGGLLREPGLIDARNLAQACGDTDRARSLAALGARWQPGQRVVSVFCYPGAPIEALLMQLSHLSTQPGAPETLVLLTPGTATAAIASPGMRGLPGLHLHALPYLAQPAFDTLLWACDLNVVRGEDSAVRALWAARPHIWQIYPQDDGVHAGKLDAFMDRWMAHWPPDVDQTVRRLWREWNGLVPKAGSSSGTPAGLAPLDALWRGPAWEQWCAASRQSCDELTRQPDLVDQLLHFVTAPG